MLVEANGMLANAFKSLRVVTRGNLQEIIRSCPIQ